MPGESKRPIVSLGFENKLMATLAITGVLLALGFDIAEPFALLTFLVAVGALIGMKWLLGESLRFTQLALPSFFLTAYIGVMALPAIAVFGRMTASIRYTYIIAIQSVLFLYPLGMFLANQTEKAPNEIVKKYFRQSIERHPVDVRLEGVYQALLIVAVPILVLYFMLAPQIQLVEVLMGYPSGVDPLHLRFAAEKLPKVMLYAFEIMRRVIVPVTILYAYLMSKVYGGAWIKHFRILLPIGFGISVLTLDRAPPVALLLTVTMGYLLANRKSLFGLLRPRSLLVMLLAMASGGIISIYQYRGSFDPVLAFKVTWYVFSYRLAQDAAAMAAHAFETFNAQTGFLNGSAVRMFSFLPGHEYIESLSYTGEWLTAAPVSFVGDLWRNWGWPAVIIGTIVIGFAHQIIQIKLLRRKTVAIVAIHAFLLLACVLIIHGNAMGIVTTSILLIPALGAKFVTDRIKQVDAQRLRRQRNAARPKLFATSSSSPLR